MWGENMANYRETCVGFQSLTVTNTEGGVQLTVPSNATACDIMCEGENVRIRKDGTAPTATTGDKIWEDGGYEINGVKSMADAKFISESSTNAILQIHYYN